MQQSITSSSVANSQQVWQKIIEGARNRLLNAGYPVPAKPKTPVSELAMPEDVENLGPIQLANLLIRLQGWYAYGTAQLAFARAELAAFEEFYEIELGKKMHSISLHSESRLTKDVLKAQALDSEGLHQMFSKKVVLDQRVQLIEGLVKSLDIQCKALTTEQIRRHAAHKVETASHGYN